MNLSQLSNLISESFGGLENAMKSWLLDQKLAATMRVAERRSEADHRRKAGSRQAAYCRVPQGVLRESQLLHPHEKYLDAFVNHVCHLSRLTRSC